MEEETTTDAILLKDEAWVITLSDTEGDDLVYYTTAPTTGAALDKAVKHWWETLNKENDETLDWYVGAVVRKAINIP